MLKFEENFSLKNFNTFGIEAKAQVFVRINNENELIDLAKSHYYNIQKRLILGGGSNILFSKDFEGLIIYNNIKGMRIAEASDDYVILSVNSGENWSDLVTICLMNKYYGLENLAMIPGKVGAAAVQNIGAYGVEQKDFFLKLKAFDLKKLTFKEFDYEECLFDYRSSIFKEDIENRYLILEVSYKLSKKPVLNFSYEELRKEVQKIPIVVPDTQYLFDTICRLRRQKLPDPSLIGNAGSFFKNPVISKEKLDEIEKDYPDVKYYKYKQDLFKISAGWLIEQCGFKGKRIKDAGVYDKHALILVNYGNASGKDILELAEQIETEVNKKFKIQLAKEVKVY